MTLNTSLALLCATLSFGLLACTATIVGGGTGGGGGQGGNGEGAAPPVLSSPTAIAISADKMYWGNDSTTDATSTTGSGGTGTDPSTLYLALGTTAPTCAVPGPNLACGTPTYAVWIGIPATLQHTGAIALSDTSLVTLFNESDAPNSPAPDDCPWGGGSYIEGTLEITSIDASKVEFTLSGTMAFDFGASTADGTYTAIRCP